MVEGQLVLSPEVDAYTVAVTSECDQTVLATSSRVGTHLESSLMSSPPLSPPPPPPPPTRPNRLSVEHPVTAIRSDPYPRQPGKPHLLYDVNCVKLMSFYESIACPFWAQRLHTLASTSNDCAIVLATACHCPDLSHSSGKLLLFWPYDDVTLISSDTNTLISKVTGPCYAKMNQSGHSVFSEVQPAQLMSIQLTEDSDISILEEKTVEF